MLCFYKIGVRKMSETQNEIKIQITPTLTTHLVAVQKRSGETVPFDEKKSMKQLKKRSQSQPKFLM